MRLARGGSVASALMPLVPESALDGLKQAALYALPAVIYFCTNNLTFLVLRSISPNVSMALGQSKVLFAGLLLRLLLRRTCNSQQIGGLALLVLGLVVAALDEGSAHTDEAQRFTIAPWVGITIALVTAFGGALAGVFNEKFLKVLEPLEQQVEMLQASISAIKSQLMLSDRRYIAQMTDDYLENHFSPGLTE